MQNTMSGHLQFVEGIFSAYAALRAERAPKSTAITLDFLASISLLVDNEEQHPDTQFASVFALSNPNRPHKAVVLTPTIEKAMLKQQLYSESEQVLYYQGTHKYYSIEFLK
jgi:hypothetical protein